MKFGNLVNICLWPHLPVKGLRSDGIKSMLCGFSRGKQGKTFAHARIAVEFVYFGQQKMRTFHVKDDNGK